MKKFTSLFLAITCLVLLFALSACSDKAVFEPQSYSSGEAVVNSIVIDVSDREIEVAVSNDQQVHISYSESEQEYYDISLSDSGELSMKLVQDKNWTDYIGSKPADEYRKIRLEVPDHLLSDLTVKTTNEPILVSSLTVLGSISLDSNGGDLDFEGLSVGKGLQVTAKNGDITGTVKGGLDDFSISCEVKKGESNLPESKTGGDRSLTASCNNGDIQINFLTE